MKRLLITALLSSMTVLANAQLPQEVVATVNGQSISNAEFQNTLTSIIGQEKTAEIQQAALNELITRRVLLQEANKLKLNEKEEFIKQVEQAKDELLINALLRDWVSKNPISDEEVKKVYDELVAELVKQKEYDVRHILVKDETEAKNIITRLKNKKASFEETAKKSSIDAPTAQNGGSLGWSVANRYLPEFAKAVAESDKTGLIAAPVKTNAGYHIIEVLGIRPRQAADFDSIKLRLREQMTAQKITQYVNDLRSKAKIETK
ncbi:peptidylprolyl isomerase [Pelistega suis]|uniref:peptidylprolyl isomerase n=1 Tax=Pelistega suis TaxID=1631957 RepID=A0A849P897_9BURK|nr:peptidylprolyl isomerase [Pelistega suis]NOL51758.1 peptidylprolyl isomerase [Pelistega suis]